MRKLYQFFALRLFWLALIGLAVMLFAQLFGRALWQLELFSHYLPHLAGLLLIATLIYPIPKLQQSTLPNSALFNTVKRPLRVCFAVLAFGLCLWCVSPLHGWQNPIASQDKENLAPLSIAYQNVNIANRAPKQAISELIATDPDIVILLEAGGQHWQAALNQLTSDYPTHCGVSENSPFAMQIYSKDSQIGCEIHRLADFPLARLQFPDDKVIYAAHPPPPINRYLAQARNAYLTQLATLIRKETSDEIMVVGDFNLSAFSPIYRDFIKDSKRGNQDNKQTLQRTTPNGLPTWLPFGIGIDHVLITEVEGDTKPVKTYRMGWQGSDHRGFVIHW